MSGLLEGHLHGARLSAFVDGELGVSDSDHWRAHLVRCPVCASAVASERSVRQRMRASCVPLPSRDLVASLKVVAMSSTPDRSAFAGAGHHGGPVGGRRARRVSVGVFVTTTSVAAAAMVGLAAVTGADGATADVPPPAAQFGVDQFTTVAPLDEATRTASPVTSAPGFVRAGLASSYVTTWYGFTGSAGR